ncbi:DUF262 domain-containing protein [Sorangium sp. So ce542]|uniref:DUF262 domain-containing protein n=1 Tax=Sorangium sp. So ce542 TaxID=3133316 RepID=UPI003F62C3EE
MATVFTPEHSPLDRIFAADTTYRIPAYQRPYSWQAIGKSERDSQVMQMWEDLWSFFEDNRQNNKEYFLGSMVIVEDKNKLRTFEVIDGQQRLTTLLLLFAAMRCFLQEVERMPNGFQDGSRERTWLLRSIQKLESFIYNEEGPSMLAALKLKVERTLGVNFNQVLDAAVGCASDAALASPDKGKDKKHREIALRYYKNRDYFLGRFRHCFLPGGAAGAEALDLRKLDEFFAFLRARVAIVLIKTSDFSTAYRIFEILNNRGLPLSNLDLLRNFVLEQLAEAKVSNPDELWERLESQYTFTEDFIGRWTESVNAAQPQASAFNDAARLFEERYHDSATEKKINIFYRDLERNLFWYNLIAEEEERVEDVGIRNAITFIKLLGNERYSYDLLLSLFRARNYQGGVDPEIRAFLNTYRTYALHVFLLGRFSSPKIYEAIRAINEGRAADARRVFALGEKEKAALASFFDGKIEKNDYAKILLAAYVWHTEETDPDVVTQHLVYEKSTLEHIIPQDPASGTNWLTDFSSAFRGEFTYRLGNMTLLTQAKNSANKNFDFSKKKQIYAKSKLPMTVSLGEQAMLTEQYIKDRHQLIVAILRDIFLK